MVKPVITRVSRRAALLALAAGLAAAGCVPFLLDPRDHHRPQDGASGEPNGCGPSGLLAFLVPECPLGVACFTEACNGHDTCYVTCGSDRDACDTRFYDDMRAICSARHPDQDPASGLCATLAYIYWQAVVRYGEPFFDVSQGPACTQPADGSAEETTSRAVAARAPYRDGDDDLLPDEWERAFGCDPRDPADGLADFDGDGLNNLQEFLYGGHPLERDSPGANAEQHQALR